MEKMAEKLRLHEKVMETQDAIVSEYESAYKYWEDCVHYQRQAREEKDPRCEMLQSKSLASAKQCRACPLEKLEVLIEGIVEPSLPASPHVPGAVAMSPGIPKKEEREREEQRPRKQAPEVPEVREEQRPRRDSERSGRQAGGGRRTPPLEAERRPERGLKEEVVQDDRAVPKQAEAAAVRREPVANDLLKVDENERDRHRERERREKDERARRERFRAIGKNKHNNPKPKPYGTNTRDGKDRNGKAGGARGRDKESKKGGSKYDDRGRDKDRDRDREVRDRSRERSRERQRERSRERRGSVGRVSNSRGGSLGPSPRDSEAKSSSEHRHRTPGQGTPQDKEEGEMGLDYEEDMDMGDDDA